MHLLRHLILGYAARRFSEGTDRPRNGAAHSRPPLHSLLDWIEASGAQSRLRASDAEREEVVSFLKRSYAEGRLDDAELGPRVEAAYRAVTVSELDRLTEDLPSETGVPSSAPNRPRRRALRALAGVTMFAALALVVASLLPPELLATVLVLLVPFALLAALAILPLALPALAVFALVRGARDAPRLGHARSRRAVGAAPGRVWSVTWRL